jgi:ribosomal protein S18 acetylase RimI-like enzyme
MQNMQNRLTMRKAVEADLAEVQAIVAESFELYIPQMGRKPAPMTADHAGLVRAGQVWIAVQDGQIRGLIVLVPADDHLYLDTIAVRPGAQGTGVGSQLLELAEREATRLRLPAITLCTNELMTENLAYYPRRGYRQTHRVEESGFRRVYFRKEMTAKTG